MKISPSLITYVENVVKTCQSVNIENVIIENDMVRAIDENRTVVLFQIDDVPELPFDLIAINRISGFLSRLEVAKTRDLFEVHAETSTTVEADGFDYVRSIMMESVDTTIDYRCANPSVIQAPKQINDTLVYRVQLNAETVSLLQKAHGAMGSESVCFEWDGENVTFEMLDINNDSFSHIMAKSVEIIGGDKVLGTFKNNYPVKTLLSLFKQNPDGQFDIGNKGILSITVNDLDVYVIPQV